MGDQSSPLSAREKRVVVINPLVQDKAGSQNNATREVQSSIDRLVRIKYQNKFDILPFTVANLAKEPLVVIGTLAATDEEGRPEAEKETYRLWLSLADLRSEKVIAKAQAYVKKADIDLTPTPHFRDSPVWTYCPLTEGYISTCQETMVGDAIKRGYSERIAAEPVIVEAMESYNAGRYEDSLALYGSLIGTTQADQPRVYNGVYLANWKLGRRDAMAKALAELSTTVWRMDNSRFVFCFHPDQPDFGQTRR